jgi:hypothetical protein
VVFCCPKHSTQFTMECVDWTQTCLSLPACAHGGVKILAGLCLADAPEPSDPLRRDWEIRHADI